MTETAPGPDAPMILVAVGGDPAAPVRLPPSLHPDSVVVAADSGLDRLAAAGIRAHHVVGDLDSVSPAALALAEQHGTEVHRHPADKDATDIELALQLVAERLLDRHRVERVLVVGSGGARLDHLLADVLLLASPLLAAVEVRARLGGADVAIVRAGQVVPVHGRAGDLVSILPMHGSADGVTTDGLRWRLVDAHLAAGTTRAVSNELLGARATVRVASGVLAVIRPGTAAAPVAARTTPYDPTPAPPPEEPPS